MTMSPMPLLAVLACALGGAIAGNAVGSSPVTDRSTVETYYQSHASAPLDVAEQRALPDHYPLVTGRGVVPVAELSDRGLFSQARYRRLEAFVDYPSMEGDVGPGENFIDGEPGDLGPPVPEPPPPLELARGPAQLPGGAKMIDVQAALAMR